MFVDTDAADAEDDGLLDLSNAVPGHVVAYEDMEDDLVKSVLRYFYRAVIRVVRCNFFLLKMVFISSLVMDKYSGV
jgi:hypothetical protein